jgi:NitT/TauT family transport system permease protein
MVKRWLYPALATIAFWGAWWAIAASARSQLLPTPWQTLRAFAKILSLSMNWHQIGDSTVRVLAGMVLGSFAGTFLGIATRYSRLAEASVRAVIYPLFQSVPSICWAIIFVLWLGLSPATPVLVIAAAVAPFFIINIWEGMKELDTNLIEMASTYTRSKRRILMKVIMPMLYPYTFAATRSSFMTSWKVVILAEVFGATSGIGYMLYTSYQIYAIDRVFAWTLVAAVILLAFDYGVFNFVDRKFMRRWKPAEAKP